MIDYLTRTVELKQGNKWIELNIGDDLDAGSVIKVSRGGSLEFWANKSKITINANGTYNLNDLIKSSREVSSWGLDTILKAKFDALTGEPRLNTEAAAQGVRGSAVDDKNMEYIDYDTLMKYGIEALNNDKFNDAIANFIEAKDNAIHETELNWASYNLAQAYMRNEQYILAQMELVDLKIMPSVSYYPGYVILQGNLYLKSSSFDAANTLFQDYIKKVSEKRTWDYQTICFLSSIAYRGLKNKAKVKEFLTKARDLDPKSIIGKTASKMITEL